MAIDTGALYYLVDPFVQWENVNGKPIVGGHVEVFEAGTDNKIITYADWDGTRHPFKIPLGSDGRAVILVDPGYRYDAYVYDSFNNLVCSRLNIIPLSDGDITINGIGQVYHDETLSGKGTPNSPLTVISGGKVYGGIYPIDVNNELDMISADNVPLGVQSPLYFAQDDDEGLVIALSSVPVPEGTMNESAFGYQDGQITSYNGSAFSAGLNYKAGSYVDIDGNTINVTGLQPAGNYQSAGDYVVHDELSSYATQDWVENQSYMKEYMKSAFYPSTSNPSGYLTAHQDISNKLDVSAFSTVSGDFITAIPSEYVTENTLQSGLSSKLDSTAFSTVSGNFLTAHQSLDGLMSASLLEQSGGLITGYNGTAFAGQGGVVSGDFELSAGSGISIEDFPLEQKTVISVTAQGGNPEVEQAVIDNSATWDSVTAKQDALNFGHHDTAISSIDNSALYDNSAQARINTLTKRISNLASNKLDTSAFSDVSASFLTAVPDTYLQNTDLSTTDGKVTAISGIPLSAGGNVAVYTDAALPNSTQLDADIAAGKAICIVYDGRNYWFDRKSSDYYFYGADAYSTYLYYLYFRPENNRWNTGQRILATKNWVASQGYLTAHQSLDGLMSADLLEISDNKITGYNGSAFKAGDEFPQSATDAISYVTATSANIDATVSNVSANSGAWGGSALPISAGAGIALNLVDGVLVISTAGE